MPTDSNQPRTILARPNDFHQGRGKVVVSVRVRHNSVKSVQACNRFGTRGEVVNQSPHVPFPVHYFSPNLLLRCNAHWCVSVWIRLPVDAVNRDGCNIQQLFQVPNHVRVRTLQFNSHTASNCLPPYTAQYYTCTQVYEKSVQSATNAYFPSQCRVRQQA